MTDAKDKIQMNKYTILTKYFTTPKKVEGDIRLFYIKQDTFLELVCFFQNPTQVRFSTLCELITKGKKKTR